MLLDRTILMPARLSTIALSFAAALVLDFLPWPNHRMRRESHTERKASNE